ncbi:hypothetical protein ACWD01_33500 [Streptomyces sp. NPDC002835]
MSGHGAGRQRVARVYTSARRHPWVLGKLGDWVIWFGPYTPAQLVVMGGGAVLLIYTFSWWSWMGPIPIAAWAVSIWAARGAKVGGRSPFTALLGWVTLLAQHPAGRVGGHVARDRRAASLTGSVVIEEGPASVVKGQARPLRGPASSPQPAAGPASGLARLLAETGDHAGAGRS